MRKITYFCDCCKQEIADIEHNVGAPNPIFGQYGEKAAYEVHCCSACIVELNKASQAVIDTCTVGLEKTAA